MSGAGAPPQAAPPHAGLARPAGPLRISLCILTWNEIEGCRLDIPRLPRDRFDEVFAVDGGSTDGTREFLAAAGIPVHLQDLPGYNGAYITAFRRCTTDAVVLFHPKGSISPDETLRFRGLLEQGYDLVIASRVAAGAVNEEDSRLLKPRKWFVMALGLVAALLWKPSRQPLIWDVLHGFRAIRKDAFLALEPLPVGLSIDLETVVRCYRQRRGIVEFPVEEKPRPSGETHFRALPTGYKLLRYLVKEVGRKA